MRPTCLNEPVWWDKPLNNIITLKKGSPGFGLPFFLTTVFESLDLLPISIFCF